MNHHTADHDTIDLREVGSVLRRGRLWILAGMLGGAAVAVVAAVLIPPRFEATTTVLLRGGSGPSGLGGQLGELAALLPGSAGALRSGMDTEIEILTSRSVVGQVVDSLQLQARVLSPSRTGTQELFRELRLEPELREGVYRFARDGDSFVVRGPSGSSRVAAGGAFRAGGAVLALPESGLPDEFEVALLDREDAITRVRKELVVEEAATEVARIEFAAGDPRTAAAVPNLLVHHYLARRRTADRGVNQHRFEFLLEHADSIERELARAEAALRRHQETSGVLDPEVVGTSRLERAMQVQAELETLDVEARALERVLSQGGAGSSRQLAAYPTFLRNPAINDVLSRLLELETERLVLLQRRTEQDPEVVGLTESIEHLESQLLSLSREYLNGLGRQQAELRRELTGYEAELALLPEQAQQSLRLQREVKRLSETTVALQTQMVHARLAAITEGGEVRQIDLAVPPENPSSPRPPLFMVIGLVGGLFLGTMGAVARGYLSERIQDPRQALRAAGVPTLVLPPEGPLLLGGLDDHSLVLVLPIGSGARPDAVARRIASSAALQGRSVALVDLATAGTGAGGPSSGPARIPSGTGGSQMLAVQPARGVEREGYPVFAGGSHEPGGMGMRAALSELSQSFAPVVVALRGVEDAATTALLADPHPVVLVGRLGRLTRGELQQTVEGLERVGMSPAGVVLHNGGPDARGH